MNWKHYDQGNLQMIKIYKKSLWPMLRKGSAVFVCAAFISTSVYLPKARAESPTMPVVGYRSLADDLTAIALPKEIGKIQETYRGTSDKIVVLIQDAHSIPDAQRSIRSAIDHFQTQYGVSLVGLEGASEKLDPQIFRSFPDKELLRKTFDAYAQRGELTGGTAAALFNTSASAYHGIEDWPLYEEGVSYFLKATELEGEIKTLFEPMVAALNKEKETVYSKELLEIDRLLANFGENKTDLAQVLNQLSKYQPPPKGSELAILIEEIQRDQITDTPIEIEIKKIAEQVASALKSQPLSTEIRQELLEFNGKLQEFRTARTTPQAFALYLKGLVQKHKIRVKVSRKLAYLVENQKRLKDIEGTRLFEEFKRYADSVKESLFQNNRQKTLDIQTRGLELIKRLTRLELSFEDWGKVQKMISQLDRWTVTQDGVVSRDEVSALLRKMEPHLAFYRVAEKRDQVFLKNIQSMMAKQDKTSSLLVAGGFHTEGLTRELKEKGISYVLVMPWIGSIPEEPLYREHMQGQVSWSNYFEVKDGKVNLYDAFVRATRDKLLGDKTTSAVGGKEWRDQIIRDLAADGRITQASEYTHFIDERTQSASPNNQPLREKWLANIDRFGEGLKKLQADNDLSEANILQLIKTITTAEPVLAGVLQRAEIRTDLIPSAFAGRQENHVRSEMRTSSSAKIEILTPYAKTESIEFEGLNLEVPAVFKQPMTEMTAALIFYEKHFPSDKNAMMRTADILKLLAKRMGVLSGKIKVIISDSSYIDISEDGDYLEISLDRFRIANEGFRPYLSRVLGGTIQPLLDNNSVSFRKGALREVIEKNRAQLKFGRYLQNEGFGYELPDEGKRTYYSGMGIERLRDIARKGKIEGKKPDSLVFTLGDDSATSLWLTDDVGLAEWHGRAGTGGAVRFKKENIDRDYQTRDGWQKGLSNEVLLLNQNGTGALEVSFTAEYIDEILAFDEATYNELTALFPDIPIRLIATAEEAEAYLREKGEMTNDDLAAYYTSPEELDRQASAADKRTLNVLANILGMNMASLALLSPRELYNAVYQKVFFDLMDITRQIDYIRKKEKRLEELQIKKRFGAASMTAELEQELVELTEQYDFKTYPERRKTLTDLYGKSAMLGDLKESFLKQERLLIEAEGYIFQLTSDGKENPDTRIMFIPQITSELDANHSNEAFTIPGSKRVAVRSGTYEYVFLPMRDQILGYARNPQNGETVGPNSLLEYFQPMIYRGEGVNFQIQIDVIGVDKYKVSITHLDDQGATRIATESFSRSEQREAKETSIETVARPVAQALNPESRQIFLPEEAQQIGNVVIRGDLDALIKSAIQVVNAELAKRTAASATGTRLPAVLDFMAKLLKSNRVRADDAAPITSQITLALNFSKGQGPGRVSFFEELFKVVLENGLQAEIFSDRDTGRELTRKVGSAMRETFRIKTLSPREIQGGIAVMASDGQTTIPMALDAGGVANAGKLHEMFQGLFFSAEGMALDADTQFAAQAIFVAVLMKLAIIAKGKKGSGQTIDLKVELIRAMKEAGYPVSDQAFKRDGRLITIMGNVLLRDIEQAYLAQSETQKAA